MYVQRVCICARMCVTWELSVRSNKNQGENGNFFFFFFDNQYMYTGWAGL